MLGRAILNIKARRRKFYPNKNFGSFIKDINTEPYEQWALAFANQALDGLDGVYAVGVRSAQDGTVLKLMINRREYEVELSDI